MATAETVATLRQFWNTITGWKDIKAFWTLYFYLLRNPVRNSVALAQRWQPQEAFSFFVQSFVIFTSIVSLFSAFKGNDILKSILGMVSQVVFMTLAVFGYYFLFNALSATKKAFSEFLKFYTVYMGFAFPVFAVALYLNWKTLYTLLGPDGKTPFPALYYFFTMVIVSVFSIWFTARMSKEFWQLSYWKINAVIITVFILVLPLQRLWIQVQCKLGITPEYEGTTLAQRKAIFAVMGCEDTECKKCLLPGVWKYSPGTIQGFIAKEPDQEASLLLKAKTRLLFDENGRMRYYQANGDDLIKDYNTPWFFSDDNKQLFFNNKAFDVISLAPDTMVLRTEARRHIFHADDTVILLRVHRE